MDRKKAKQWARDFQDTVVFYLLKISLAIALPIAVLVLVKTLVSSFQSR